MKRLSEKYGRAAMALHWMVAIVLSVALVLAWVLPRRTEPGYDAILELHKAVGMMVLVLVLVVPRLLWRLGNPVASAVGLTSLEARLSELTHWALYAVMLIIPLTGYLFSSAEGQHIDFFGLFTTTSPLPADRTISRPLEFIHKTGQYAIYGFVGLHVLAALYHHFVKRDGVLRRMLPLRAMGDD
ncbi:MAG TPA: cytochrome b [Stellaceae bacterium]|nr:cytochrome b [Stellaceae bacterium]